MNRLMKTSVLLVMLGIAQCHALSATPLNNGKDSSNDSASYSVAETAQNQALDDKVYLVETDKLVAETSQEKTLTTNSSRSSSYLLLITISLAMLHLILMLTDRRHQ